MITIKHSPTGRSAPIMTCDYCRKQIKFAALAWALWKLEHLDKINFVHKKCLDQFTGKTLWKSSELNDFLRRLIHNIGADISEDTNSQLLDKLS